jgi:hypothetical protein
MSAAEQYCDLFANAALPKNQLLEVNRSKTHCITLRKDTTIQLSGYRIRFRNLLVYPRESMRLYTTDRWLFSP